jgi:dihydroxy-acid dehydratase
MLKPGRRSWGQSWVLIGHIMPEAMEGGPIAPVEDGNVIEIDEESRALNLFVEPAVLLGEERKVGDWREDGAVGKKGTSGSMQSWCGMQVTGVSLVQIEGSRR